MACTVHNAHAAPAAKGIVMGLTYCALLHCCTRSVGPYLATWPLVIILDNELTRCT